MIIKWKVIETTDHKNLGFVLDKTPELNDFIALPSGMIMMVNKIEKVLDNTLSISNDNYILLIEKI